jgi:RNA polymerase sigma-70 factor (ECF subfamily)
MGLKSTQVIMATSDTNPPSPATNYSDCIIAIAKDQDKAAFKSLFDYYAGRLKSFYLQQGLNAETAEELVQEVFVMIWRKAEQFDPAKANASTWIYTIARNKRIDYLRKDIRRAEDPMEFLPDIEDDPQNSPEEKVIQSNLSDRIQDILKHLPEEQAKIIRQSYFQGLTHQEIAAKNKIPLGTVKSRMRLAIERLKTGWNKEIKKL